MKIFLIEFLFIRRKYVTCFVAHYGFVIVIVAGPSIPPAVSYMKRPQANSVESDQKEEWDKEVTARKLGSTTVGSKSEMTASPLVGPERKKSSPIPSVSILISGNLEWVFVVTVLCLEEFLKIFIFF